VQKDRWGSASAGQQPGHSSSEVSRLLEALRAATFLQGVEALDTVVALCESHKQAAKESKPLSVKARQLEGKISHKKKTLEAATKREEKAVQELQEAKEERTKRQSELEALEKELAELPVEAAPSAQQEATKLHPALLGDREAEAALAAEAAAMQALAKAREALAQRLQEKTASQRSQDAPSGSPSQALAAGGEGSANAQALAAGGGGSAVPGAQAQAAGGEGSAATGEDADMLDEEDHQELDELAALVADGAGGLVADGQSAAAKVKARADLESRVKKLVAKKIAKKHRG